MGPTCLESLLEHFIFTKFLGGGPPNPPPGKVTTHKYSHHQISNPPFTNPKYTHASFIIKAYMVVKTGSAGLSSAGPVFPYRHLEMELSPHLQVGCSNSQ